MSDNNYKAQTMRRKGSKERGNNKRSWWQARSVRRSQCHSSSAKQHQGVWPGPIQPLQVVRNASPRLADVIISAVKNSEGNRLDETALAPWGWERTTHQSWGLFTSGQCHPCQIHLDTPAFFFPPILFQMPLPGTIFTTLQCKKLGHRGEKLSTRFDPSLLMIVLCPLNHLLLIHFLSQLCHGVVHFWYHKGAGGLVTRPPVPQR